MAEAREEAAERHREGSGKRGQVTAGLQQPRHERTSDAVVAEKIDVSARTLAGVRALKTKAPDLPS